MYDAIFYKDKDNFILQMTSIMRMTMKELKTKKNRTLMQVGYI